MYTRRQHSRLGAWRAAQPSSTHESAQPYNLPSLSLQVSHFSGDKPEDAAAAPDAAAAAPAAAPSTGTAAAAAGQQQQQQQDAAAKLAASAAAAAAAAATRPLEQPEDEKYTVRTLGFRAGTSSPLPRRGGQRGYGQYRGGRRQPTSPYLSTANRPNRPLYIISLLISYISYISNY
jgi:hypothetical protein